LGFRPGSKWNLLVIITVIGFACDWFSKYLVVKSMHVGETVPVIGKYAQFLLVYNKAALWGIDPRKLLPSFPLNGFFLVFSIIAIFVVIAYYRTVKKEDTIMRWGISLILPGALGNLWDRIAHAHLGVVDFVRLGVSDTLYWPIFNMADAYVTIGVCLILLNFFLESKRQKALSVPKREQPVSSTTP
jgi:signal peptidase II